MPSVACRFIPWRPKSRCMKHDLASSGSFGLSAKIPDGMRATSVKTNEVMNIAGFIFPGSHVDVLVTLRGENNAASNTTHTVLQNVQVLATGNQDRSRSQRQAGKRERGHSAGDAGRIRKAGAGAKPGGTKPGQHSFRSAQRRRCRPSEYGSRGHGRAGRNPEESSATRSHATRAPRAESA